MNATAVGHEAEEDFASEAVTVVAQPIPAPSSEPTLPPTPHGTCVNCGREVALLVVATDGARRTFQWVPTSEPARPGRRCSEAAMPAYHWADGGTAAVYHVAI